ncbi:MAG TPA: hypothetical protein VGM23_09425 [Armatimonadota bacterium]|jgi:hypothetical protein
MNELFPIVAGLVVGALLGLIRPSMRFLVGFILAIILGGLATFISGEFEISWGFLLVDIPLVAVSSFIGLSVSRRVRLGRWNFN